MRILTGLFLAALTASLLFSDQEVRAAGVYVDASGDADFLVSPHRPSVHGDVILTEQVDVSASMYVVSVNFDPHPNVLIQLEQAYISTSHPDNIITGFGDVVLVSRINVIRGDRRILRFIGTLRSGNGSVDLFPYSTESLDVELAFGYVDSLDVVYLWAQVGVANVNREDTELPEALRHDDHIRVDAGLAIPIGSQLLVRGGLAAMAYRIGSDRQIYFAGLRYDHSDALGLHGSIHFEGGPAEERVSDGSFKIGIDVNF